MDRSLPRRFKPNTGMALQGLGRGVLLITPLLAACAGPGYAVPPNFPDQGQAYYRYTPASPRQAAAMGIPSNGPPARPGNPALDATLLAGAGGYIAGRATNAANAAAASGDAITPKAATAATVASTVPAAATASADTAAATASETAAAADIAVPAAAADAAGAETVGGGELLEAGAAVGGADLLIGAAIIGGAVYLGYELLHPAPAQASQH